MLTKNMLMLVLTLLVLPNLGTAQCKLETITATAPTSQFADNQNGTVTDRKTGLMWKKCAEGQDTLSCAGNAATFTWQNALARAQAVNTGLAGSNMGYGDWRVPNVKELMSIMEEQCYYPAINLAVFPNTASGEFWSSSPANNTAGSSLAWYVSFGLGEYTWFLKDWAIQVRLVRSGQ